MGEATRTKEARKAEWTLRLTLRERFHLRRLLLAHPVKEETRWTLRLLDALDDPLFEMPASRKERSAWSARLDETLVESDERVPIVLSGDLIVIMVQVLDDAIKQGSYTGELALWLRHAEDAFRGAAKHEYVVGLAELVPAAPANGTEVEAS